MGQAPNAINPKSVDEDIYDNNWKYVINWKFGFSHFT